MQAADPGVGKRDHPELGGLLAETGGRGYRASVIRYVLDAACFDQREVLRKYKTLAGTSSLALA